MDDFITLRQLATELGMNRAQTRQRLREHGIRPHKVYSHGLDGPVVLALTRDEAERVMADRAAAETPAPAVAAGVEAGTFFIIQLVPDLDPRRIKLGFSRDAVGHLSFLKAGAPTAKLLRAWPCRPAWSSAAFDCVVSDCRPLLDDVYECKDHQQCASRGDLLFGLLPGV